MATEQEELKLTVTLIDNASGGLDRLKESLKEIGGGSVGGNKHLEKFTEQNKAVTETVKKMTGEMGEAFKSLGMLRLGFLGGAAGVAAFGAEVTKQMKDLVEYAEKLRGVNQAARQIGVDPAQLKNIIEQFEAVGVSSETAVSSISAIAAKIAELQRTGSQLRLDLMRQAGHDPQAVKNMEDYLNRLTHAKSVAQELRIIREGGEQVYRHALEQTHSEQEAANRRNQFWQMQGYDAQLMALKNARELTKAEQEAADKNIAKGNQLADTTGKIAEKWNTLIEELRAPFLQPAIDAATGYLHLIEKIETTVKNITKQLGEQDEKRQSYLKEHPDAPRSAVERLRGWMGGDKENKHLQENTDQLKRLNDAFDQLNGLKQPSSYSGGGFGGGIVTTAFHPPSGAPMFGGGGGRWGSAEYPNLGSAGQVPQSMGRSGGGAPYGSDTGGATGTPSSGPAGDPSVPSDVLEKAKAVALHSGPGGVEAFMRNQGYPKAGNWCGEFAASVVKSAGGTPPKDPAIASNWRKYGSPVEGAPQPGDVAVRKGVPTGSTGSHVTFVEGYDPKTGRFTGIGGNQGSPRSSFPASQYDYRRGGMPNGAQAGGGSVNDAIRATAGTAGMDEAHWKAIAGIESSLNPSSNANRSTQYKGLFQIGRDEWARTGQGSIYNAMDNAQSAARLASDNNAWFKGKYGRDPTPTETYMMHQQGRGFYSRGSMTNIGHNLPPDLHGPQTHASFEAGWGREIERRAARNQLDGSQVASTRVEGTGKLTVDVNAPKGTNVGAEGGGLFKKVEMNRQTQMSPARRGPEGGYATESML